MVIAKSGGRYEKDTSSFAVRYWMFVRIHIRHWMFDEILGGYLNGQESWSTNDRIVEGE